MQTQPITSTPSPERVSARTPPRRWALSSTAEQIARLLNEAAALIHRVPPARFEALSPLTRETLRAHATAAIARLDDEAEPRALHLACERAIEDAMAEQDYEDYGPAYQAQLRDRASETARWAVRRYLTALGKGVTR